METTNHLAEMLVKKRKAELLNALQQTGDAFAKALNDLCMVLLKSGDRTQYSEVLLQKLRALINVRVVPTETLSSPVISINVSDFVDKISEIESVKLRIEKEACDAFLQKFNSIVTELDSILSRGAQDDRQEA
jgi:hypothetical protein